MSEDNENTHDVALPVCPPRRRCGTAPSTEMQAAVRSLVDREGVAGAARSLGTSPPTVTRIVAGLDVQPGTVALVDARLRSRTREG